MSRTVLITDNINRFKLTSTRFNYIENTRQNEHLNVDAIDTR